jgi:hypothetical protein
MDTDSFGISMEQQLMIRLFTLKLPKAREIHNEFEWMYSPEAVALPRVKKWRRRFRQGRTDLFDDPQPGRLWTNDSAGPIGSMLEERLFCSCKV